MSRFRITIGSSAVPLALVATQVAATTATATAHPSSGMASAARRARPLGTAPQPRPAIPPQPAEGPPANIFVTDKQAKAYTSPWIAKDPTNVAYIAIAYMEGGPPGPAENGFKACHLALTNSAGNRWDNRTIVGEGGLFPLSPNENKCAQPAVIFGPDWTLYYLYTAVHFVFGEFTNRSSSPCPVMEAPPSARPIPSIPTNPPSRIPPPGRATSA